MRSNYNTLIGRNFIVIFHYVIINLILIIINLVNYIYYVALSLSLSLSLFLLACVLHINGVPDWTLTNECNG